MPVVGFQPRATNLPKAAFQNNDIEILKLRLNDYINTCAIVSKIFQSLIPNLVIPLPNSNFSYVIELYFYCFSIYPYVSRHINEISFY